MGVLILFVFKIVSLNISFNDREKRKIEILFFFCYLLI